MPHKEIMTVTMDDGTPDGTLKVDLAAWDCAMYRIERSKLQNYENDSVLAASGIYFLIGEENRKPTVYVGQANFRNNGKGVLGRVREHNTPSEPYWNEAFLIYSCSNSLYATELNYLERNLWEKIQKSSFCVKNASKPTLGNCSPATQLTMDRFVEGIEKMIGIFRYSFLIPSISTNPVTPSIPNTTLIPYIPPVQKPVTPIPNSTITAKQFFIKRTKKKPGRNVDAVCEIHNSQFVVLKGSLVATTPRDIKSPQKYNHDKYANLIDESGRLTKDILFSSVSGSSAFVVYGSSNGNVDWKDENGQPIKNFIP